MVCLAHIPSLKHAIREIGSYVCKSVSCAMIVTWRKLRQLPGKDMSCTTAGLAYELHVVAVQHSVSFEVCVCKDPAACGGSV